MRERLEETLRSLQRHFSPFASIVIIINDYKEEEHIENKIIETKGEAKQLVEVEQLGDFSLEPIEGGFFDVEPNSPNIPITIPTKVRSKCMRRHEGKE
jgi:hypothetical protein